MTTATLPQPASRRQARQGFTLIELMVVLGIIVLVLAAAVPAFNYITGSRSTDAAENMISAMLVRARARAVETERPAGVAFFVNPRDGRATMAIVTERVSSTGSGQQDEDPYPLYRGWAARAFQSPLPNPLPLPPTAPINDPAAGQPPTAYKTGHEVIALHLNNGRYVVQPFVAIQDNAASGDSTASPSTGTAPPRNPPWQKLSSGTTLLDASTTQYETGEFETLPAGVGVQLVNDPKNRVGGGSNMDLYVQTGVILFDGQGRLVSRPFAFSYGSTLFQLLADQAIQGNTNAKIPNTTTSPVYSQLGVILYDRNAFASLGYPPGDTAMPGVYLAGPTAAGQELGEETWLGQNTTPLFVNRYNGSLLRGQ